MYLVHLGRQIFRQRFDAIHDHALAVGSTIRHGDLAQRVSGLIPLSRQSGDDTNGGIVLV